MIHLAATYGHQAAAQERLMRAYFTEGEAISDRETLVRLVAELGVDADEARDALELDRFAEDVREDEQLAVAARDPGRAVLRARPPLRRLRRAAARGAARRPSNGPGARRLVSTREDRSSSRPH